VYISFEPLELRTIFCRDDGTKGVCKLDDLSPYGYNFSMENETIEHIFWGCENVQNLLGQVNSWFGDKDINQTFFKKTLIFGDVDKVYKEYCGLF
jgi:hypothetical protein